MLAHTEGAPEAATIKSRHNVGGLFGGLLWEADAIVREELIASGPDREVWQFRMMLLAGVRNAGVRGEECDYGSSVVFRLVSDDDAMMADRLRLPYELLEWASTRIANEVREINRVVLHVTSEPPSAVERE